MQCEEEKLKKKKGTQNKREQQQNKMGQEYQIIKKTGKDTELRHQNTVTISWDEKDNRGSEKNKDQSTTPQHNIELL